MKTLKKVIALAIVATMVMGLCAINVSAAENLPGFKVEFENASGNVVTSAKAGATLTANVYLPAATYQNAAVTLIPAEGAVFSNIVGANGVNFALLNILTTPASVAGQAQAKATSAFTMGDAPYFSIDVTIPADAPVGNYTLFTIKSGSAATADLGEGNLPYTIPTDGWDITVLDGFKVASATYLNSNTFEFGITETYLEEFFADKQIRVLDDTREKYEDFDIDEVTVEDSFVPNKADTFEKAVKLTVKKESFTDDKLASSDEDVSVDLSIIVKKYDLANGYDLELDPKNKVLDLVYTVNAAGGQMDEDALVADFNGKEYTGKIKLASKNYEEDVKITAFDAYMGPLDLTKASDLAKDENVAYFNLLIVLPDGTNLEGDSMALNPELAVEGFKPVKAYVKKKNKASSGGSNIGIDTGSTITVNRAENGTVSASAETAVEGTTVTITATPAEGYVLDEITVKDSRGADIAVENGTFIMPARDVKISATFKKSDEPAPGPVVEDTTFTDVPLTHWAVAYIEALKDAGIVDGVKEEGGYYFYPDNAVTRAEFTKMIVNLFGLEVNPSATVQFKDALNDWYTPYIAAAVEAGYVNGVTDTEFAPNATISRQDAFTILGRAYSGVDASETNVLSYEDSFDVADYAMPYLQILVHLGFVGGDDNNKINPKANITRAESAKIIASALAYNADALETEVISDVTGVNPEEVEAIKAAIVAGEILYAEIDDAIFVEITGFTKAEVIKALAENDKEVLATFDARLLEFIHGLSDKDIEAFLAL